MSNVNCMHYKGLLRHALRIIQLCVVWYLVIAGILFVVIDRSRCVSNRLNGLKYAEEELDMFKENWSLAGAPLLKRALRYYQALAKVLPRAAPVYGNIGFCHFYLGNTAQAIESYRKAIALEPSLYIFYWDLGMIYFQEGDYAASMDNLQKSSQLLPQAVDSYTSANEALTKIGREDMTFLPLKLIKRAREDDEKVYVFLAECSLTDKKYKDMRRIALSGLIHHPESQELFYLSGQAEVMLREYKEAVAYFNKAIEMDEDDINAYFYRALCMKELGKELLYQKDMQSVMALKAQGFTEGTIRENNFSLHLNSELITLRYQVK